MLQGETRGREEWGLTGVSLLEMKRHKAKHVKTLPLIFIWWNVEDSWWCTDVVPAQITSHLWKWVNKDIPSLPLIFAFTFSGRNIRIIENHNGKAFSKLSTNYNYENLGKIDFFSLTITYLFSMIAVWGLSLPDLRPKFLFRTMHTSSSIFYLCQHLAYNPRIWNELKIKWI